MTIYLLCVLAWPDSPEQMSSSLSYPTSSSSHAYCACTSALSQKQSVPDHWCNSSSASSPWLSRVVEAWLNWFDGCPVTVVEKGDMLMMDSPNAESIWPSLLLNTEKNVIRITISSNLPVSRISVCGRNPITLQFKWKLLFCGAANYSPVVLFIVLYKVVVTFQCVNEILWCYHSNESYSKQYFPVVLFILLYKVVLTFETVEEILWCDHSIESYCMSSTFLW